MTAAEDIALVADARPAVVELARVLSLAAHIDVPLVRTLRTRLFAGSDVSTEADLWSSVLVEARGEGELVLRNDVREALWNELRAKRDALRAHWEALTEVRAETPPLLQLEERLTFHALDGDLAAIDRELRTVIAAMRDEPDRRRNLAAWSAEALDHLPAEVRETEAARILGSVARSWVATPLQIATLTPAVDSMDLVKALQPETGATTSIYLRRLGDTLEVGTTPLTASVEISGVPTNNPVLIVDHEQPWPLDLRGITRIPVRGTRVMIGTLDRRRWWLEPEQEQPNVRSIRTTTENDGVVHTVYLVSPDHVVTAARWLTHNPRPIVSLGGWRPTELVAVDDDADIALLRLREPVREPPLEFEPDARQGQSWQAFPFGTRIVGTIATAWPGVTIRLPFHVTMPLPPGTPIFRGTKVICHVGSEPMRDGVLHTVSARLIRWWLEEVAATHPSSGRTPDAHGGQDRPYGSGPYGSGPYGSEEPSASQRKGSPGSGPGAVRSGAFSSAFSPSGFSRDEPEAAQQAVSMPREPRVWVHSKRSTDVPRELTLQGAAEVSNNDLVVVFVGDDERRRPAAVYRVVSARSLPSESELYLRTVTAQEPAHQVEEKVAQMDVGPTSAEILGRRVVDLPPPPDDLLRANQREIASYASAMPQRDTRTLGTYNELVALLWRLQNLEESRAGARVNRERAEARDLLRQLFGPPPSESVATLPVVIELPARISTGGLLGTTLAHDGDVRRFRRHQWGEHEVSIVIDSQPSVPNSYHAIRVKILDIETDSRAANKEFAARLFRNSGKEAFYNACTAPPPPFSAEVILGPRREGTPAPYDLELIVNRVPKVAPAHAYRRGVQFVIAVLDAMEHAGEARWIDVLHIPGCGELDLVDAQHRVRAAGIDDIVITWIDSETDLIERRYTSSANPGYTRVAAALGGEVSAVFGGPPAVSDLLTHRFGVARERSGRSIMVGAGDLARVSVQATDTRPVRGYVAFYATTSENHININVVRVRAKNGVATCELPRRNRGYTIGAVVEDEGVILEAFVDAKPANEVQTATGTRTATETQTLRSNDLSEVSAARVLYEQTLASDLKTYGEDHARVATDRNNLAGLLRQLGELPAARVLYEQALVSDLKTHGEDHPAVATDRNRLAGLLQDLGDLSAARVLYEQALASDLKTHGEDHPAVATDRNRLAGLLQDLGELPAARVLYEQALASDLKTHGEDHPEVATDRNRLAGLLQDLGDLSVARVLYEQALASDLKTHGEDHPAVATDRNRLAGLLQDLGDLSAARVLYEQALASDLKTYGEGHPEVATDRNRLAGLLQDLGELPAARVLYEQALASDLKTYGEDHPEVAIDRNRLAGLLQDLGDLSTARVLYEQALASDLKTYGEDHPEVATDRNDLAMLLQDLGELPAARALLEQALASFIAFYGHNHPTVAKVGADLAALIAKA